MYFNVLTMPPSSWPSPLPRFLQFLRDNAPILRHPVTDAPLPSWAQGRHLVDFASAEIPFLIGMAEAIHADLLENPGQYGAFLDNAYRRIIDWMIPDFYYLFPPEKWALCARNFDRFLFILEMKGVAFIANGDREIPSTLYLELAQRTWLRDTYIWENLDMVPNGTRKLPHVLSVEAGDPEAVDRLVALHNYNPTRWIAFTTQGSDEAVVDAAYALAAAGL